jgi:hypothetical protein
MEDKLSIETPSAEILLERLNAIDPEAFSALKHEQELKGRNLWLNTFAMPISAIILCFVTLTGAFVFDRPFISFGLAAAAIYFAAKLIQQYEMRIKIQAFQNMMDQVKNYEGDYGLIPHFQAFLPERYRHLWQSLRKGDYQYVKQYQQAVVMLQNQLDHDKFIHFWLIQHPELAENEEEIQADDTELSASV